jgi:hypothetical protein
MARKIKYGKIAVVIFLTALIWVWADLAQDEKLLVSNVTIVAKSANPSLLVAFGEEPSVSVDSVVLKGAARRIADVARMRNEGSLDLRLFLDTEQQGMTKAGEHSLPVLSFLRQSDKIRQLGLTVESCEPEKLSVNIVKLVKKLLTVRCFDENGIPLQAESLEPSRVEAFVPDEWAGEKLAAKVELTRRELSQARTTAIEKTPYIELLAGQSRELSTAVKIKMPLAEDILRDYLVTATLGIALSPNLQGKFKVEISNLSEVISPISIRATAQAKQAYEAQPYPLMTLYILDHDATSTAAELRREVIYNLPEEFVRRGEIISPQHPAQARFKLIPLSAQSQ